MDFAYSILLHWSAYQKWHFDNSDWDTG